MKQRLAYVVLLYFKFWAKLQLKKYSPDSIGITGSTGKTTTRDAVAAILKTKYHTRVTERANSESGIPLHILGLSPRDYSFFDWLRLIIMAPIQLLLFWQPHEKYVIEMGIDSPYPPKNMEYLLSIIRPRTGIFLNAKPVHSAAFDPLSTEADPDKRQQELVAFIALEKGKLITALPATGLAVLNDDDPNISRFKTKTAAQVMLFGTSKDAHVKIAACTYASGSTTFTFIIHNETVELKLPYLLPDHFAYSLAAAACVGLDEGMSIQEIQAALSSNFHIEPGRMSMFEGVNGSTIIDSSYNASAETVIEAVEMMAKLSSKRKIAVLGDIRELGSLEQSEHQRVLGKVVHVCDRIILVGPVMKRYGLPYLTRLGCKDVQWFANAYQAGTWLKTSIQSDDLILIKGSQNTIYLETAVELLLKNSEDTKHLCRRGRYWNNIRSRYLLS